MKVRKFLAVICCTICLAAYGVCGYVSYLSWKLKMVHRLGFLIFLPVWIAAFWFATFFSQLVTVSDKNGETRIIFGKRTKSIFNNITNIISVLLLAFWVYLMYKQYRDTGNFV